MIRTVKKAALLLAVLPGPAPAGAWDFTRASIPVDEIREGGPPKDGIPALTLPDFVAAADASCLAPEDRVLGLEVGGDARAQPLRILSWHGLVNDVVGGVPLLASRRPPAGANAVYAEGGQ